MRWPLLFGAFLAAVLAAGAAPAYADGGTSSLSVGASQTGAGEPVAVSAAVLAENGDPLAGADVVFSYLTSFGGATGFVPIGRATTDERGVATLEFVPRTPGKVQLRADVTSPDGHKLTVATANLDVADTPVQLYKEDRGFDVFGSDWILVGVLGSVWTVLLLVAFGIADIATGLTERNGQTTAAEGQG